MGLSHALAAIAPRRELPLSAPPRRPGALFSSRPANLFVPQKSNLSLSSLRFSDGDHYSECRWRHPSIVVCAARCVGGVGVGGSGGGGGTHPTPADGRRAAPGRASCSIVAARRRRSVLGRGLQPCRAGSLVSARGNSRSAPVPRRSRRATRRKKCNRVVYAVC